MKATALIAAAALAFGTAAFAQDGPSVRKQEHAPAHQDHGSANNKMRSGMHRLAEKTRSALHRMGDKMHHVASREHDRRDNDTRAMGGPGTGHPSRDAESARQARMDDAYSNWQNRHDRTTR